MRTNLAQQWKLGTSDKGEGSTTLSSLVESVDTVISSAKYRPKVNGPEDRLVRGEKTR